MRNSVLARLLAPLLLLAVTASCGTSASVIRKVYWADVVKGTPVLDVIVLSEQNSARVGELGQTIQLAPDTMASEQACIPDSEPVPDEMLPKGTPISLLTPSGPQSYKVTGHCAGYGAGENHWYVFLAPGYPQESTGMLAARDGDFSPEARLLAIPDADPALPQNQALIQTVRPYLCKDPVPELAQELCQDLTFTAETTQIVRGHFGAGMTALVALRWVLDEYGTELYSALFAVDENSHKVITLVDPEQGIYYHTLDHIGDIDGDGIDEVVVGSSYYEGNYFLLLDWEGTEPDFQTITGDGA